MGLQYKKHMIEILLNMSLLLRGAFSKRLGKRKPLVLFTSVYVNTVRNVSQYKFDDRSEVELETSSLGLYYCSSYITMYELCTM